MLKKGSRVRTLLTIFFTVFLNMLGLSIVIPVLAPLFLTSEGAMLPADLSFGDRTLLMGLLIACYPILQFFGAPLLGQLSDIHGRKRVLLLALGGSFIGYVLFAIGIITDNLWLLFIGRSIDGLTGGNVAIINSSIADISDEKNKATNFGIVGMAFGFGFIIGPFLGGVLSDPHYVSWFTFSTPFWFASLLILINLLLVWGYFPETLTERHERKLNAFSGFRNLAKAFQLTEIRSLLLVLFLVAFGFTFFTQFFQVYLIEKFDYRQSEIGELFAYIGIWIALTQGGIIRLVSRFFQPLQTLRVTTIGLGLTFILLLFPQDDQVLYFILPFVSLFQGLNQPNLLAMLSNQSGKNMQGQVMGVTQSLQSLALAVPPIVAGIIVRFDINYPIITASISLGLAWLLLLVVVRQKKAAAKTAADEVQGLSA